MARSDGQTCRCPMCRRFPMTMRKISELESKPLSAESRAILKQVVDEAYRKMGQRIAVSAPGEPRG